MKSHELDTFNKTLAITFNGDVLSTNSEELRAQVFGVLESDEVKNATWDVLSLDLTSAKMIDSTGLNLIISIIKTVKNRGAKVKASISSMNIHRTFLFTRLDTQLELTVINPI